MGVKESVERFIRRQPSEADLVWRKAGQVMEEVKGKELMIVLASEQRQNGDESAIVQEYAKNWNPWMKTYVLRWGLKRTAWESSGTSWESNGVRINASSSGEVSVDFTRSGGWHELYDRLQFTGEFGEKIKEFFQQERTPSEKVKFAMELARPAHDYRFGENTIIPGLKYKGIEKKVF